MRNIVKFIIFMNCVFLFFANSIQATNQSNISCGPLVLKRNLKDEFRPDGKLNFLYLLGCSQLWEAS
jgi:hypothetical protein